MVISSEMVIMNSMWLVFIETFVSPLVTHFGCIACIACRKGLTMTFILALLGIFLVAFVATVVAYAYATAFAVAVPIMAVAAVVGLIWEALDDGLWDIVGEAFGPHWLGEGVTMPSQMGVRLDTKALLTAWGQSLGGGNTCGGACRMAGLSYNGEGLSFAKADEMGQAPWMFDNGIGLGGWSDDTSEEGTVDEWEHMMLAADIDKIARSATLQEALSVRDDRRLAPSTRRKARAALKADGPKMDLDIGGENVRASARFDEAEEFYGKAAFWRTGKGMGTHTPTSGKSKKVGRARRKAERAASRLIQARRAHYWQA